VVRVAQDVDASTTAIALPGRTGTDTLAANARVAAAVVAAPAAVLGIGLEVHQPAEAAITALAGDASALPTFRGPAPPLPTGQPLTALRASGTLADTAATALVPPAAGRGRLIRLDVGGDGPAEETGEDAEHPPPRLRLIQAGHQLPGESVKTLLIHLNTP
jgi:hypothetical protein